MTRWLHSARFDLGWIVAPAVVPAVLVAAVPALRARELPPWAFLLAVVAVDVAHVWASLYRTYLDPDERRRRRLRYLLTPALCFAAGVALYAIDGLMFWRALAYLAVFHFVRQQYGLVMIYRRLGGERDRIGAAIDKLAIYATMLYPLAYWHATPDRAFNWFIEHDFVPLPLPLPASTRTVALVLYTLAMALFALKEIGGLIRGTRPNVPKLALIAATALTWYVGIVAFNSDVAFTLTNTVAHGVPYLALVWIVGRRKWTPARSPTLSRLHAVVPLFVGLLIAVAWLEEALWDRWVWHEHAALFPIIGGEGTLAPLWLLVPLLAVPQATHYVVDAWIWKLDGSNPELRQHLLEG